ncbi:MAG: glutamyl-tRNA reductase [Porphyromonadaceae bacterium]|nr:glutamyl-tRNA reductase [Porphyromonadaceae bacterium]
MIGLIGISHQTASQDDRGLFALTETEIISLVDDWIAMRYLGGAIVLSTCNRVEIYCDLAMNSPEAIHRLLDSWLVNLELRDKMRSRVSLFKGEEVYRHLFRLASGLESMVLGETQILGQVKDAYRLAVGQEQSTPILSRLFHKAFEVAKRVRSRYLLSVIPISAASVAVDILYDRIPWARGMDVLIIGAGQMAEATLEHLVRKSVSGQIAVYNRTRERAERLIGSDSEINIYSGDELRDALASAKVIFVTTSAAAPIVLPEYLADREEVAIFDMAVPRNVSLEVGSLSGVHLFGIDDLSGQVVSEFQSSLLTEVKAIVEDGVREFSSWLNASEVRQVIGIIQRASERLLASELALLPTDLPKEHQELVLRHAQHLRTTYTTALASSLRELAEGGNLKHIDTIGNLFSHVLKKLER